MVGYSLEAVRDIYKWEVYNFIEGLQIPQQKCNQEQFSRKNNFSATDSAVLYRFYSIMWHWDHKIPKYCAKVHANNWIDSKYASMYPAEKLPLPSCIEIITVLQQAWKKLPAEIVR